MRNGNSLILGQDSIRAFLAPEQESSKSASEAPDASAIGGYTASEVSSNAKLRISAGYIKRVSISELADSTVDRLNDWLNSGSSGWQLIRDKLIHLAPQSDTEIRLILDVKDIQLRRLPWQEWQVFRDYYRHSEVALRAFLNDVPTSPWPKATKIRILVVVGESSDINTAADLKVIQDLESLGVEIISLMQPDRKKLQDMLRDDQGYHIFVYTGHSQTETNGQVGWLKLNSHQDGLLSINDFKHALEKAVRSGLRLAIFNSCDGLGLANEVAKFGLAQSIIMREPVPDEVAIEFLKRFFNAFANNKRSLIASVREARESIENFNGKYPGVIWLPTPCIKHDAKPITWQDLEAHLDLEHPAPHQSKPQRLDKIFQKLEPLPIKLSLIALPIVVIGGLCFVSFFQKTPTPIPSTTNSPLSSTPSSQPLVPSGTKITIRGSTSLAATNEALKNGFERKFPGTKIDVEAGGSERAIESLLNNNIQIAASSRPLNSLELAKRLQSIPIGINHIAVVVGANNPFKGGLESGQIRAIFSGDTTVSIGSPVKLRAINRPAESGTRTVMKELLFQNKGDFGANVTSWPRDETAAILKELGNDGISYASCDDVKRSDSKGTIARIVPIDGIMPGDSGYRYQRDLFYVYRLDDQGKPSQIVKDFLDYAMSPEGKQIIETTNRCGR